MNVEIDSVIATRALSSLDLDIVYFGDLHTKTQKNRELGLEEKSGTKICIVESSQNLYLRYLSLSLDIGVGKSPLWRIEILSQISSAFQYPPESSNIHQDMKTNRNHLRQ